MSTLHPLCRCAELSDPAHVVDGWACSSVKPLVGGPQLTAQLFRQGQVVGILDGPLLELAGQFQRSAVKIGRLMEFEL